MNNYKKGFLALSILASFAMLSANAVEKDERIHVNTFVDEDGENSNACSLREAITAAAQNKPYGGCTAGKTQASVTDAIVLPKGEYLITKPLKPASQINISGTEASNWNKKDVITGDYPARLPLATTIKGTGLFPLFDTSVSKGNIILDNIALLNGGGTKGGAIFAGAAVTLNKVSIKNSKVSDAGGAIYLSGVGTNLTVTDSVFEGNSASTNAILGMTCIDNLTFNERKIQLTNVSIVKNGDSSTKNIIEICGKSEVEIINNTIAENEVSPTTGSILKFTADSLQATQQNAILSSQSSLKLLNNTIVNNKGFTTFLYDAIGSKALSFNIIAYNEGLSCRYLLGSTEKDKTYNISTGYNGLIQSKTVTGFCDIPYAEEDKDSTIDLSNIAQSSILSPLKDATELTAFFPVYFLIGTNNPLVDIAPTEKQGCHETDQRGKVRLATTELIYETENENTCDVGAIEKAALRASDITTQNTSQTQLITDFETQRDLFKDLIDSKDTNVDFLGYYKIRYQEYLDKLNQYPKTFRYRQNYVNIFAGSLPHEILNKDNVFEIQHFNNTKLYNITVESLGTAEDVFTTGELNNLPAEKDPNLKCEWNDEIEQVLVYRTDGKINQAGDYGYCKYTITLKSDPNITSTGLIQTQFVNIAPTAKDDEFILNWGGDQKVKLDLLANDNDDGDGKVGQPFYPIDKKKFYVTPDGISAPIKISKIDSNLEFEAQYQAPCPDESGAICYGGDMYIKPKNNFNKFNYSFTYEFYDADAAVSNTATVKLINTATTSEDSRKGGGSLELFGLLTLGGLVYLRRKK